MNENAQNPIRKWRAAAKLSLEEACNKFTAHDFRRPSTAKLSRIETGEQPVPIEMIPQFEIVTGMTAKEICPDIAKIFAAKEDAA